jgi:tetratricopeptide (TPR) repeat protein
MSRATFLVIAAAMTVVAAAVRLNNAISFPVLGGYDAFAHFTYIWFVAVTGQIPLASQGWEFFQPPLYYELMAAIWRAAGSLDGETRLRIGKAVVALAGLAAPAAAYAVVRWRYPSERLVQLLAAGSMMFLPVNVYSAGFTGNEGLNSALGNFALLVLVWTLRETTKARAATLGVVLGLAMLTKFTAIVVVVGSVATLALRALVRREPVRGAETIAIVLAGTLVVCGGYYLRNVRVFGNPFQMSRGELYLVRLEDAQVTGRRGLLEYVLFDPGIVYRPQWPRGLSVISPRPPGHEYSALREAVPTGLFANAWFDGFGSFVLPPITQSETSRRAGQLLLLLALAPTSVLLFGAAAAVRDLVRDGWDDSHVAMLATLGAMAVVVVQGTRTVPMHAAVKATYIMLVGTAFAYLFGVGLVEIRRRSPRVLASVTAVCAALAVASVVVFAHGRFLSTEWSDEGLENSIVQNMYGVLFYAAGDRRSAEAKFRGAAERGLHLGYENLATIAAERGELDAAKFLLRMAALRQPLQIPGTPAQRNEATATTQAEYANTLATFEAADGRLDAAMEALETSRRLDPSIPESAFNLGAVRLWQSLDAPPDARNALVSAAEADFLEAERLDPAFPAPILLRAVAAALRGDCRAARQIFSDQADPARRGPRKYPVETGPGDLYSAGLRRRRIIDELPPELSPDRALQKCPSDSAEPAPA